MNRKTVLVAAIAAAIALITAPSLADETCNSPYLAKLIKGQEDYIHVWTLGVEGLGDGRDKLVTIDVNPASKRYGQVVHKVSVGGKPRGECVQRKGNGPRDDAPEQPADRVAERDEQHRRGSGRHVQDPALGLQHRRGGARRPERRESRPGGQRCKPREEQQLGPAGSRGVGHEHDGRHDQGEAECRKAPFAREVAAVRAAETGHG